MNDLPQHVLDAIAADVAKRLAAAPPPSAKEIEVVQRLTRQFRIGKAKKRGQAA